MASPDHIDPETLQRIFDEALRLAPSLRASFLAKACGGNGALRAEVESLLAEVAGAEGFLKSPTISRTLTTVGTDTVRSTPTVADRTDSSNAAAESDRSGQTIGRYVLRGILGEGSFGTVYLAEQIVPYKRAVALKVLRPRPDVSLLIEQFRNEQRLMARMEHPNIAKVLDAGETPDGVPYLVVEQIKGLTLTRHCEHDGATIRERLQLMLQVCRGVQHAHGIGIIHRDLKPSNILVATYDGVAQPKVIDFGIARQLQVGDEHDELSSTDRGGLAGTLLYLSPERADVDAAMGDVQGDVYALGVVLFELLTGSTPLPAEKSNGLSRAELLRLIRQPEQPSVTDRLSEMRSGSADPERRRSAADVVRRLGSLGKEIDWVVGKAIAKERADRYATVKDFASDIECLLANRPVQAGPDTLSYQASKFLRRHRAAAVAASLLGAAIVLGSVGTSVGLVRANAANSKLIESNTKLIQATEEAQEKQRIAEAASKRARGFSGILSQIVTDADPMHSKGHATTLADLLDTLQAELKAHPELQPDVAGPVYSFVARGLAADQHAIDARRWAQDGLAMVQSSLPRGSSEEADAQLALANACMIAGDFDAATAALDAIASIAEADTGSTAGGYYALRTYIAICLHHYDEAAIDADRLAAIETPPGVTVLSPAAINAQAFRMFAALGQHDGPRARLIAIDASKAAQATFGSKSGNAILWQVIDVGIGLQTGEVSGARERLEQLLPDAINAFGPDHQIVATVDTLIAMLYLREQNADAARPFLERAQAIGMHVTQSSGAIGVPLLAMSTGLGDDPKKMIDSLNAIVKAMPTMRSQIDPAYAAKLVDAVGKSAALMDAANWKQIITENEPLLADLPDWDKLNRYERGYALTANYALMLAYAQSGRANDADAISLQWLNRCPTDDPEQGEIFVFATFTRWLVLAQAERWTDAAELIDKRFALAPPATKSLTGPFYLSMMRGTTLVELHRLDEAEPLLNKALAITKDMVSGPLVRPQASFAVNTLMKIYKARGDAVSAERLSAEYHLNAATTQK